MRSQLGMAAALLAGVALGPGAAPAVGNEMTARCTFQGVLLITNEVVIVAEGVGAAPGAVSTTVTCRLVNNPDTTKQYGAGSETCPGSACATVFTTGVIPFSGTAPYLACVSLSATYADGSTGGLPETCTSFV